jgi:hypothetical protein
VHTYIENEVIQLQEIGAKLEQARKKAPRSPAQPSALKKAADAILP